MRAHFLLEKRVLTRFGIHCVFFLLPLLCIRGMFDLVVMLHPSMVRSAPAWEYVVRL